MGVLLELYRGVVGIMEKKMETTIMGYIIARKAHVRRHLKHIRSLLPLRFMRMILPLQNGLR